MQNLICKLCHSAVNVFIPFVYGGKKTQQWTLKPHLKQSQHIVTYKTSQCIQGRRRKSEPHRERQKDAV